LSERPARIISIGLTGGDNLGINTFCRDFKRLKEDQAIARSTLPPLPRSAWRVSVVLPVFSETATVEEIVRLLAELLGSALLEVVIVLSPRSAPASREVCGRLSAMDPRVRLHVQEVNPGLGNAVREGYALTRGNLVLNMDSDGEMEMRSVGRMLEEMERTGAALVVASRWMKGGGFSGYSPLKYVLNFVFQQIFRLLFLTRIHDLTYGYKLMRGELARGIAWRSTLHEIACETTLAPMRLGVPVSEVPTRWTARTAGASKNTFLRNFRYLWTALRILARRPAFQTKET
jgi:dolichol-phosphate mannosyltransferase